MAYEIGTTIMDELKLCYVADVCVLDDLKAIEYGEVRKYGDFALSRCHSHHFQYSYDICLMKDGSRCKVATACFGRYGEVEETNYFYYRLENRVLYDFDTFCQTLSLPDAFSMEFHNITSIDIAIDLKVDVARIMKRMWHRKDITTIINGKAIKDRSKTVKNLNLTYSTTLDRLRGLTVYVKQAKALHNKARGVTVQAYNKSLEIQESSHKDYIKEFYGCPKRLYRLEVHLNSSEVHDYCRMLGTCQSLDMVYDRDFLKGMFYYHLSSVIRFTKGRTKIAWEDIIHCNGRV